jgi:7-alpha-hydroxysteroid dehydrogenase
MILDRFLVTDRAAIVTGAGRGIGAATAVALAEAGADVLVSSRTASQLAEVVAQVEKAGRRGVAGAAEEAFGRLDIVVNNVGGAMPREFLRTSPRHLEEAFHFNVSTAHALTRAATPLLLASGHGAVVNISSVMGRVSGRGYAAYGTAKAALSHYTRLIAQDLAPRVRVNAIGVGSVATSALDIVLDDDAMRTAMEDATPVRRIGDVEDIAATVLFLASDAGAYLTGKVVEADGGLDRPNLELGFPDLEG